MSWQENAVARASRVYRETCETNRHRQKYVDPMEAALRAALLLIEVTPGMKHDGGASYDHPSVYMGGPSEQGKRAAARIFGAMLTACAKESP